VQPLCNNSEEKKVKFKTNKQQIVLKPITGSSPNYALSIYTINRPSQSRETVPFMGLSRGWLALKMAIVRWD
jgi:hypothetical protein